MHLHIKLFMSVLLSVLSIVLFLTSKSKVRRYIMIAMLLSTIGDFFMTDTFKIGSFSTIPGALFFMAGHVVYGISFITLAKNSKYKSKSNGTYFGIGFMVLSAIVLGILAFTIPEEKDVLWFFLILLYIAVIGFNLVCNFNYSFQKKGIVGIILSFAIILFYATDYWIFLDMLNVTSSLMKYVWYFYPLAQLLLIVFSEKIKIKG